jgi:YjbE family integral membrane protein
VEYLKLAGGLFILWIAVKVLVDANEPPETETKPRHLMQAVWFIVFADLTMSTDNVLAVAAVSGGSMELIVFGLAVSIPIVIFSANLLAELMNRYPITIYVGSGILGYTAGEMILTDRFAVGLLHPSDLARTIVKCVLAVAVVAIGKLLCRKKPA